MNTLQRLKQFWNGPWLQEHERQIMALVTVLAICIVARNVVAHRDQDAFTREDGSWAIAQNLVYGKGYTVCAQNYFPFCGPGNEQTAMRPAVPVLLMAFAMLFSSSHIAGVVMQGVLYIGTAWVIYASLKQWDGRLALLAAFLWVISIAVIHQLDTDGGDMAAAFFFSAGIVYFQRGRQHGGPLNWILFGLFFGLAALCRSVMLGIAAALALALVWERRARFRQALWKTTAPALLSLAAFGAVLAPWAVRNKIVFGASELSGTLVGYNIYRMNYFLQQDRWVPHYVGPDEALQAIHALIQTSGLQGSENEAQMQTFYAASGLRIIRSHLGGYVLLSLYRFLPLWFDVSVHEAYGQKFGLLDGFTVIEQAFLLLAVLVSGYLHRKQFWPLVLSIVLATGAYMAVDAQLRYLTDVMPAIVILAASAATLIVPCAPEPSFPAS